MDGATVSFVNGDSEILCEGWMAGSAITKFFISTGQVIDRIYCYLDSLYHLNEVGVYDMVIEYWKVDESIVIEDFLEVFR